MLTTGMINLFTNKLAIKITMTQQAIFRNNHFFKASCIALCAAILLLSGCSKDDEVLTADDRLAAQIYDSAHAALVSRNYANAIILYKQLRNRFPFGRYAEQGQLDLAYAYHRAGEPENVSATVDRFIRTYPTHPNVDYAYYLRGLTYYEQNVGLLNRIFPERIASRDQSLSRQSFDGFSELLRRYPQSRYAPDARQRMVFLRNNLAGYEIAVAEYYMRRKAYIAAVNRIKFILEAYPGTTSTNDGMAIMAEAYEKLELPELAKDARDVLVFNDPSHPYITGKRRPGDGFFSRIFSFR